MNETRNIKLDNFKGILIYLVVLGHLLFSYKYYNSPIIMKLVMIIYSFHMPLFFIISGYFSKKISKQNLFKSFICFCILNLTYVVFDYLKEGTFNILCIKYSSWYLLYIFIYRLLVKIPMVNKIIKKNRILTLSLIFIFSSTIGFINFFSNYGFIVRLINFLFYFIFGYLLELNDSKILHNKSFNCLLIVMVFIIFMIIIIPFNLSFFMGYSYNNLLLLIIKFIFNILNINLFYCIYNLIPNHDIKLLTNFGKNSFTIYFFHRIFTIVIVDYFIQLNNYLLIIVAFIFSIIMCLIFSNEKINTLLNNIVNKIFNFYNLHKVLFILIFIFIFLILLFINYKDNIYNYIYKEETISYEELEKLDNSITLGFVGDLILLEDQVKNSYNENQYDFDYMFANVKSYFNSVDYMIGVLEGPSDDSLEYSIGNFSDNKLLYLNYPTSFLKSIKESGIDLVTTSNNHLLDKGLESVYNTIDNLNNINLDYVGSYKNASDKEKRKIIDIEGIKVGFLAYTYGINYHDEDDLYQNYSHITNYLCDSNSKYFKETKVKVKSDFDYLKQNDVDLIVVLPHYGTQFSNKVDEYQKLWNDIFVSYGANIILGDHSHSVQPIEYIKDTLVINSPGNFVNSYIENDGDISMMVKVYIEKDYRNILGASVIPLLAVKNIFNGYYSVPIYDAYLKNISLEKEDYNRLNYANELVTKVSINKKINISNIENEYFYFKEGYKTQNKYIFKLTSDDKNSIAYKEIDNSNSICFIGDSITEGTLNSYHPWYEPLISLFNEEKIINNISKGGYTSYDILDNYSEKIKESDCDLYIINIGTNDIRYNITDASNYINNIKKIISLTNNKKVILLSPFRTTAKDKNLITNKEDKKKLYDEYDKELEKISKENEKIYYININNYIKKAIEDNGEDIYLLDGVHPNNDLGIKLYSYAILRDTI